MITASTSCMLPIESYSNFYGVETNLATNEEKAIQIFWFCEYVDNELAFMMHFEDAKGVRHCSNVGAKDIYGMSVVLSILCGESDNDWINILSTDNTEVAIRCNDVCGALVPVLNR